MQLPSPAAKPTDPDTSHLVAMLMSERQGMEAKLEKLAAPQPAVDAAQLAALQARLEALHVAKLLADEELHALEDTIADFVELEATAGIVTHEAIQATPGDAPAAKLVKLVALSERIVADSAFARQARRKYV